jgi:hypothetical protein
LSFPIRGLEIGAFVNVTLALDTSLTLSENFCVPPGQPHTDCWGGEVALRPYVKGGLMVDLVAEIIESQVFLEAGLRLSGGVDCKEITYGLEHTGLKGKGTFKFFDGFIETDVAIDLIDPGPIGGGSIPLP